MLFLNHLELWLFILFQGIFHKNSQHIHCIVLSNIRNIYVNILIVDLSTWNKLPEFDSPQIYFNFWISTSTYSKIYLKGGKKDYILFFSYMKLCPFDQMGL